MSEDDDAEQIRADLVDATQQLVRVVVRSSQAGLPINVIAAEAGLSEDEVARILEDGKRLTD